MTVALRKKKPPGQLAIPHGSSRPLRFFVYNQRWSQTAATKKAARHQDRTAEMKPE
jgi:hypothetical protein